MRVLLAAHRYPPASIGGTQLCTRALARRLARDHDVAVLHASRDATRGHASVERTERDGVRVHALNNLAARGFEGYRDPEIARRCLDVLDAEHPDVLHVAHLNGLATGLVFGARERGIPIVMTLHDFGTLCPLGQLFTLDGRVCEGPEPRRCLSCVGGAAATAALDRVGLGVLRPVARHAGALARVTGLGRARVADRLDEMRRVLRTATVLIAPSRFLRDRMAALGVERIEVLENGHEPLAPVSHAPDPQGRVRFGFVGSAIPSKGVHILAEAWRRLGDPRALLRIHGPFPPYHGDRGYEARIREPLGDSAEASLRGPFLPEQAHEILAGIDVLVIPSLWEENAPLTLREAYQARLPVIVSDHGGLAEAVREGVDGLRFAPGDVPALAAAMRRLLDDAALRKRLGSSPPPVPDMDTHASKLLLIYERAAAQAGAGRPARA